MQNSEQRQEVLIPWWPDAGKMLGGLGRTKTYELVQSGDLPSVLIGRRRLVVVDGLREYVRRLAAQQACDAERNGAA